MAGVLSYRRQRLATPALQAATSPRWSPMSCGGPASPRIDLEIEITETV